MRLQNVPKHALTNGTLAKQTHLNLFFVVVVVVVLFFSFFARLFLVTFAVVLQLQSAFCTCLHGTFHFKEPRSDPSKQQQVFRCFVRAPFLHMRCHITSQLHSRRQPIDLPTNLSPTHGATAARPTIERPLSLA